MRKRGLERRVSFKLRPSWDKGWKLIRLIHNSFPAAPQEDKGKEAREKVVNELKGLMFAAPKDFDGEGFRKFLVGELFAFGDNVDGEAIFKNVVKETEDFFKPENYYISTHDVQCCIKGLCSDELMSPEKKAALKELSDNGEALEEVASLLSNRLKNVDRSVSRAE